MSEAIEYEQLGEDAGGGQRGEADLRRLGEVPMELSVELGRARMTVAQTLELRPGSVVALERAAGSAADLLVNGTPIARGEVVVVEEHYGLRVSELLEPEALEASHAQGDAAEDAAASAADAPALAPAPGAEG